MMVQRNKYRLASQNIFSLMIHLFYNFTYENLYLRATEAVISGTSVRRAIGCTAIQVDTCGITSNEIDNYGNKSRVGM